MQFLKVQSDDWFHRLTWFTCFTAEISGKGPQGHFKAQVWKFNTRWTVTPNSVASLSYSHLIKVKAKTNIFNSTDPYQYQISEQIGLDHEESIPTRENWIYSFE